MDHVDVQSKLKWTNFALWSCYASLALSVITLVTDLSGYSIRYTLFERFGSIMVLCGVFLEYQIGSTRALFNNYNTGKSFRPEDVLLLDDLTTKREPNIRIQAHIFVISGTLIWGFGSLLETVICKT